MAEQRDRSIRLNIGGKVVESIGGSGHSLRVAFDIGRDKKPDPNTAEIAVYGLSESSRSRITENTAGNTVSLEVGYQDDLQQIFFGVLRRAETVRNGPDVITRVFSGDGEDQIVSSRINKSFAKGTPVGSVLQELTKAMGFGPGNSALFSFGASLDGVGRTLKHGVALNGPAAEELNLFCKSLGLEYSIQNGAVQILSEGGALASAGPFISPKTGLIGSPEIDSDGNVLGTALILPNLLPGVPFALQSEKVSGKFVAEVTKHYGDTHDQAWYVDFKGKPLG